MDQVIGLGDTDRRGNFLGPHFPEHLTVAAQHCRRRRPRRIQKGKGLQHLQIDVLQGIAGQFAEPPAAHAPMRKHRRPAAGRPRRQRLDRDRPFDRVGDHDDGVGLRLFQRQDRRHQVRVAPVEPLHRGRRHALLGQRRADRLFVAAPPAGFLQQEAQAAVSPGERARGEKGAGVLVAHRNAEHVVRLETVIDHRGRCRPRRQEKQLPLVDKLQVLHDRRAVHPAQNRGQVVGRGEFLEIVGTPRRHAVVILDQQFQAPATEQAAPLINLGDSNQRAAADRFAALRRARGHIGVEADDDRRALRSRCGSDRRKQENQPTENPMKSVATCLVHGVVSPVLTLWSSAFRIRPAAGRHRKG